MRKKIWIALLILDIIFAVLMFAGQISHWDLFRGAHYFEYRYFLLYIFWITPFIMLNLIWPKEKKIYIYLAIPLSAIIATGSWYLLSYRTFYDEEVRTYSLQRDYFKNVLKEIDKVEEMGQRIDPAVLKSVFHYNERGYFVDGKGNEIKQSRKAAIKIYKNNQEIFNISSIRANEYDLEVSANSKYDVYGKPVKDFEAKPKDEILIGNNYKLVYEYYNRPRFSTGLIRAFTFSCLDVRENKVKWLSTGNSWYNFITNYLYERSYNFWLMFYACFFVALIIAYGLAIREHDRLLKEKNDELDLAYKKLNRFKLMYQKMFEEYETAGIDDNKQILQRIDFTWPKMLSTILADDRHELKNDLLNISTKLKGPKKQLYDEIIGKAKEDILNNLRRLPDIISYETTLIPVPNVIGDLNKQLENLLNIYKENEDVEFTFNNTVPENACGKCDVNIYRLKSMVVNLLNNASQACQECGIKALDEDVDFVEQISLTYSISDKNDKHFLSIAVKDNAGGIPKAIFDDLYVNPVTSREGNRQGEGTMYVAFFAEYMDILIEKKNIDKGAEISLLVPIKEDISNG